MLKLVGREEGKRTGQLAVGSDLDCALRADDYSIVGAVVRDADFVMTAGQALEGEVAELLSVLLVLGIEDPHVDLVEAGMNVRFVECDAVLHLVLRLASKLPAAKVICQPFYPRQHPPNRPIFVMGEHQRHPARVGA